MSKKEAHRFKHKIVVSEYLIHDLDKSENTEIFTVPLGQKLSSEKLVGKIHFELSKLSDEMLMQGNEYRSASFFVYAGDHENHGTYEQRAALIIDAIQSFFIENHQSKIETVYLVGDNHLLRGVLMNRSTKH